MSLCVSFETLLGRREMLGHRETSLQRRHDVLLPSGMLHQLMGPGEVISKKLHMCKWMSKLNYIKKAVYVTVLCDAKTIQLKVFKYIAGISNEVIPNWSIDEKTSLCKYILVLYGVIYHENNIIVKLDIKSQQKLQCSSNDYLQKNSQKDSSSIFINWYCKSSTSELFKKSQGL